MSDTNCQQPETTPNDLDNEDDGVSITFVVGAGASQEVKMPTGFELKTMISRSLAFKVEYRQLSGGDPQITEALYHLAQRKSPSFGDLNEYVHTAHLIASAMPQAPSIDNFIDCHRSDPRVAECGKLAIAANILKAERNSLLYVDPRNVHNRLRFENITATWFNAFFELLTLNTNREDLLERMRRVRIISFNYDRCIEHFLHCALQNYYDMSPDKAAELLSQLVILHPYGTVGRLPWQPAESGVHVAYGAEISSGELIRVASGLRTFTEGTDSAASQINLIRSSVLNAERLVFLGFAYHELNLEVLFGKSNDLPTRYSKEVYGSAYGLSESNKRAIAGELANLGRYDAQQITLRRELTAAQVLPEYSRNFRI
jgi:hypothetical protein